MARAGLRNRKELEAIIEELSAVYPPKTLERLYQAATDGTDQMRYVAGADAEQIIAMRKAADDATYMQTLKTQFGL